MAAAKTLVLVTGANGGIGFEIVAQLLAKGSYHVLLGSRSSEKGEAAVKDLRNRSLPGSVELLPIDVTKDEEIAQAASTVERNHGKLDVLVNNAGIAAVGSSSLRQRMQDAFNTNATGTAIVTDAFGPLLRKSSGTARIVNVSTGAASIGIRLDPNRGIYNQQEVQYRASKAAMNMVAACQVYEYMPAIKVLVVCPGYTVSNLSSRNTAEHGAKPVGEAVQPIIDIIEGKRDDEAGKFLHSTGTYPW